METLTKEYEPQAPASHHTRSRNTLVFTEISQLRPEHQDHPARYRFCRSYLSPEDQVLDCASGCGYGAAILAEQGASVTGIELHQDLVDFARENWARPNVDFQQFDVSSGPLPFANAQFSVVVSLETIEHVPDPLGLLREFRRVLRLGGLLLISTPQAPMGNPNHIHEFTLGELCRALEEAGFPVGSTFTQQGADEFLPCAAPAAGRQNFVVAGQKAGAPPLTWVADEQYELLRMLRREHEQAKAVLEQLQQQVQLVHERGEREMAGALLEMRNLQSQIRELSNLRAVRLSRRMTELIPLSAIKRLLLS